jgi:hypothetical protein
MSATAETNLTQPLSCLQILAGSAEQLSAAKNEVSVLQALSHVNCLSLLAHSITQSSSAAAGRAYEVLLVFPAYQVTTRAGQGSRFFSLSVSVRCLCAHAPGCLSHVLCVALLQDGTLLDELDRLAVEGSRLSSRQVLEIFRQVRCVMCSSLRAH